METSETWKNEDGWPALVGKVQLAPTRAELLDQVQERFRANPDTLFVELTKEQRAAFGEAVREAVEAERPDARGNLLLSMFLFMPATDSARAALKRGKLRETLASHRLVAAWWAGEHRAAQNHATGRQPSL